jgi:hypothetical protein
LAIGIAISRVAGVSSSIDPSKVVSMITLALGLLLLVLVLKRWRSRPKPGEQATLPKWMGPLHKFAPGRAWRR